MLEELALDLSLLRAGSDRLKVNRVVVRVLVWLPRLLEGSFPWEIHHHGAGLSLWTESLEV